MFFPQILFTVDGDPNTTHSLDMLKLSPKITIDKGKEEELADGTTQVASEVITFESAVFRADKEYFDYLRFLNNQNITLQIFDINVPRGLLITIHGIKISVSFIAQTDDSALIRINASREVPPMAADADNPPITLGETPSNHGLLHLNLTDHNGAPTVGLYWHLSDDLGLETFATNIHGNIFALIPAGTYDSPYGSTVTIHPYAITKVTQSK